MSQSSDYPRRKNIRLHGYDYSIPANYFITIVIQDRKCLLGNISNGKMVLSEVGEMVRKTLKDVTDKFEDSEISHYVIMPNHIHFIIQNTGGDRINEIVRWMKSLSTNRYLNGLRGRGCSHANNKLWQRNYFDHIIRNQHSYDYIANYIFANPQRWKYDKLNIDCVEEPDDINLRIRMLE